MTRFINQPDREAKSNLLSLCLNRRGAGIVHSKFRNSLNVQFDDWLLHIGCSGSPLSAFGMNLAAEKLRQLLASVRTGDIVVNKISRLIFYCIDGVIPIDYQTVGTVDLTLPRIKCKCQEITAARLYHYLANIKFESLLGIRFDEETADHVKQLLISDKEDLLANQLLVRFFAGRGSGLTPSGDDILLGFTLALLLFGGFDAWRKALEDGISSDRTTMISVSYLRALLQGYASEPLIRLVRLLDGAETGEIETVIQAVQSHGHTSGNDTLFGFYLGLRFLTKPDHDTGQ